MSTIDSLGQWFPRRGFHRQRVVGFGERGAGLSSLFWIIQLRGRECERFQKMLV
jgi:hypothetical protein